MLTKSRSKIWAEHVARLAGMTADTNFYLEGLRHISA
jgi:hypothetical protein